MVGMNGARTWPWRMGKSVALRSSMGPEVWCFHRGPEVCCFLGSGRGVPATGSEEAPFCVYLPSIIGCQTFAATI